MDILWKYILKLKIMEKVLKKRSNYYTKKSFLVLFLLLNNHKCVYS